MEYEESMKLVDDTLAGVNDIRTSCGFSSLKRMRPGRIGQPCNCPIANSLKEVYEAKGQDPQIEGQTIPLPSEYAEILADKDWVELETYTSYSVITDIEEEDKYLTATKPVFEDFIDAFDAEKLPKLDVAKGAVPVE